MEDIVIKYDGEYDYLVEGSPTGEVTLKFDLKTAQRLRIDLPVLRMSLYIERYGVLVSRWADAGGGNV